MGFKKVKQEYQCEPLFPITLRVGDIIASDGGQYYIVATTTQGTTFIGYFLPFINKEIFEDLTLRELIKIKPHILNRSKFAWHQEATRKLLDKYPNQVCDKCADDILKHLIKYSDRALLITNSSIGTCYNCKAEKVQLNRLK